VAVGFGAESSANETNIPYSATPDGKTSSGRTSNYPIKPGSFVLTSDTSSGASIISTYTDRGDATCTLSYDGTIMGTINCATGVWSRSTTVDVTGIAAIYGATYTRYQYNATPAAGVNTTATGIFSTSITVPATLANGNYNVTAVDASGNKAVASLTVNNAIPETLPLGTVMLLSMFAVVAVLGTSEGVPQSRLTQHKRRKQYTLSFSQFWLIKFNSGNSGRRRMHSNRTKLTFGSKS
jgi:hypothetical protein